jgi:hypothetical protein
LDYHEPYDFCYDVWLRDGVSYEPEGRTIIAEDAGDDYIRPEQTQEEKDYFYWLDQYTSNIKWNAHKVQKEALEKWQSLSGDKGEPPKQINMDINGYWNQTGFCTCHEPNFLPPALITTF